MTQTMITLNGFDNDTYTVNCEDTAQNLTQLYDNVKDIFSNYTEWAGYNNSYENFKYSSFEIMSTLEYPYLVSAFCQPVDAEIE